MPIETDTALRAYWPGWVEFLQHHGLGTLTAWVLESTGPLALLAAQAIHFGRPLLRPALSGATMDGLIDLLENEDERCSFIVMIREAGKA